MRKNVEITDEQCKILLDKFYSYFETELLYPRKQHGIGRIEN